MEPPFSGASLRLARVFNAFALEDVAGRVGKTRQYIHKLETGQSSPTSALIDELATALGVEPGFFAVPASGIADEHVHFRKLFTTRAVVKHIAMAKAEVLSRLIAYLDRELKLPEVRIPTIVDATNPADIERAAEMCRRDWGLGLGPIGNMTRLAESVGAVVTTFESVSREVDALSVIGRRPLIVRNEAKESPCRQRFDVGHELGHCALHQGRVTGDRITESEANRFAGALLIPRSMMAKLFPRPRGYRLDWRGISDFKMTWKVSKAAALYRARQLNLIDEHQYRTGVITLKRTGEAIRESEDHLIASEAPELLKTSFMVLRKKKGRTVKDVAAALRVKVEFLREFIGVEAANEEGRRPQLRLVAE